MRTHRPIMSAATRPLYRFAPAASLVVRDVDAIPPGLDWTRVQLEVPDAICGGVSKIATVDVA